MQFQIYLQSIIFIIQEAEETKHNPLIHSTSCYRDVACLLVESIVALKPKGIHTSWFILGGEGSGGGKSLLVFTFSALPLRVGQKEDVVILNKVLFNLVL